VVSLSFSNFRDDDLTLGDILIFLTKFLGIKFLVYEKRVVKEYIASFKIVEFELSIIGYV
jgi:hypothetical protein